MTQRLPIVLSVTALVVALLGATPYGEAAGKAAARFAKNAGKVGGFAPSKTSKKNTVVVRGANGKIDVASLPVSRVALGQVAAQGAQGPQGPQGPAGPGVPVDLEKGSFALFVDGAFLGYASRMEGCKDQRELIEVRQTGPDGQVVTRLVPGERKLTPCRFDLPMPAAASPLWGWLTSGTGHRLVVARQDGTASAVSGAVVAGLTVPSKGLLTLAVRGTAQGGAAAVQPPAPSGGPIEHAGLRLDGQLASDTPGDLVLEREIVEHRQPGPDGQVVVTLLPGEYEMKPATPRTTAGTAQADTVAAWTGGAQTRTAALTAVAGDRALTVPLGGCLWDEQLDAQPRADGRVGWGYRCATDQLTFTPDQP
jgi:hypothetical protein